jgi:cobalt/nickel transport system permease protein
MSCLAEREKSILHRMDERVKILSCVFFIVMVVSLKTPPSLFWSFFVVLFGVFLGRVGVREFFARLALALPFELLIIVFVPFTVPGQEVLNLWGLSLTLEGLQRALLLFLKMEVACSVMALLILTTGANGIIRGLRGLGLPQVMTVLMEFILRYFELFRQEMEKMNLARKSRGYVRGRHLFHRKTFKVLGEIVGGTLIRSYERSRRVYQAMLSRGYAGHMASNHFHRSLKFGEIVLGVLWVGAAVVIFMFERSGAM